jgi:hypothetical protein
MRGSGCGAMTGGDTRERYGRKDILSLLTPHPRSAVDGRRRNNGVRWSVEPHGPQCCRFFEYAR